MGIADRDYYREQGRWHNPFVRSQVTVFLVVVYLFVFVAQTASMPAPGMVGNPKGITGLLELNADAVFHGEVWRTLSYTLIHQPGNFLHVIFTVVFLLWIGRQVEDLYGNREFLAYFVFTSLLGGVAFLLISAVSPQQSGPLIGPSGAVTALFVLFALHYPSQTIHLFYVIPVPIWALVILYAAYDVAALSAHPGNASIVGVHVAGAAFAFVYHRYSLRVLNWLPVGGTTTTRMRQPKTKLRIFQEQQEKIPEPATASVIHAAGSPAPVASAGLDEHFEAKLDEVLDKVNKSGKGSLTEAEQKVLLRASEIYKTRRRSN